MSKLVLDFPYALVTITGVMNGGLELEVWPKHGVSSFIVLSPGQAHDVIDAMNQTLRFISGQEDDPSNTVPENVIPMHNRKKGQN